MKPTVPAPTRLFHRFPMLRVERLVAVEPGISAQAILVPSSNDVFVRGACHYPAMMLVEAIAQVAALFAEGEERAESGTLAGLGNFSFGPPVAVGSVVTVSARSAGSFGRLLRIAGEASVDGQMAARGEVTIAL